jgi:hypothetical protein
MFTWVRDHIHVGSETDSHVKSANVAFKSVCVCVCVCVCVLGGTKGASKMKRQPGAH